MAESGGDWAPYQQLQEAAAVYLRDPQLAMEALRGVVDLDAIHGFTMDRFTKQRDGREVLYQEIAITDGRRLILWMGDDVFADDDGDVFDDDDDDEPAGALFESAIRVVPLSWIYDVSLDANYRVDGQRRALHSVELRIYVGSTDYTKAKTPEKTEFHSEDFVFSKSHSDGGVAQAQRLMQFGKLMATHV